MSNLLFIFSLPMKVEFEDALMHYCPYVDLEYPSNKSGKLKTWQLKIVCFNPPHSKFISKNVSKAFLQ